MRIFSDDEYASMDLNKIESEFKRLEEHFDANIPRDVLLDRLKIFHRKRHLSWWHDGSSVSNHGHLQMTFCTTYDKALFYTNEEYFAKTGIPVISVHFKQEIDNYDILVLFFL